MGQRAGSFSSIAWPHASVLMVHQWRPLHFCEVMHVCALLRVTQISLPVNFWRDPIFRPLHQIGPGGRAMSLLPTP